MSAVPLHIECVDAYVNDIKKYPLLKPEEEPELARLIREGTPEQQRQARDKLICSNLRLVVKIAHSFKRYGLGFADLVSEGNMGLLIAVNKYDPSNGAKFSYYASWWIKQSMRKAIAWQSRTIRIPGASAQKLVTLNKARTRYMLEHGREPTDTELADITGIGMASIELLNRAATDIVSMDEQVNTESATTFDALLSETEIDDAEELEHKKKQLSAALARLTQLEYRIITEVYGLDCQPVSLEIISQEVGMSLYQLREKLAAILLKLRTHLEEGASEYA